MSSRLASLVLIAGFAVVCVSTAQAQERAPGRDRQPPVLEGPRVQDGGVPGERRRFGPGSQDRRDMQREIPHPMFMRVVGSLKGPQADANVRLSEDQVTRIDEIDSAFNESLQAFRKEHAEEIRTLLQDLPPEDRRRIANMLDAGRGEGRPGDGRPSDRTPGAERPGAEGRRPAGGDDRPKDQAAPGRERVDPAKAQQAREHLKELMQKAPKPGDTHTKIVGVLNTSQKKSLEQKLENLRKEMEKRRAESGGSQGKAPQGKDADKAGPKGDKGDKGEAPRPDAKRPDGKRPEGKRPGDTNTPAEKRRAPKRDKD